MYTCLQHMFRILQQQKGKKAALSLKQITFFSMFKSEMLKSKHELEFYRNCSNIKLNYIKHLPSCTTCVNIEYSCRISVIFL